MNLEPAPRLSKTIFLIVDGVLLLTAFLIIFFSKDPYAPLPFVSAVICVALASIVGLIPFLIDYAADSAEFVQQERERVTEQTQRLHAAGESLMRAASQIKAVEEAVQKSAHTAENLPYRMQEKLAEFNQQLEQSGDEEKERLHEEIATLRQSESERLQAITDKIHKAAAEWSALESTTRKQLAAAQETAATKIDAKINAVMSALDAKLATFAAVVASAQTPPPPAQPAPAPTPVPAPAPIAPSRKASKPVIEKPTPPEKEKAAELPPPPIVAEPVKPEPEIVSEEISAPAPALQEEPVVTAPFTSTPVAESIPEPTAVTEPAVEAEPVIEPTAVIESLASEPVEDTAPIETPAKAPAPEPVIAATVAQTEEPKPKKARAARKPKPEEFLLEMSEFTDSPTTTTDDEDDATVESTVVTTRESDDSDEIESSPEAGNKVEAAASSDGATRLLATAYIGIGNKLFIRGDGPGLSWDKGVPMQFVSIGKWGWASHDANAPVRAKLYKNDDLASLSGEITLPPGKHVEITALF